MTTSQARAQIARQYPERAARADAVDPLPPPCTCTEADKLPGYDLARREPELYCSGTCRSPFRS